jgi:hypothetical protein
MEENYNFLEYKNRKKNKFSSDEGKDSRKHLANKGGKQRNMKEKTVTKKDDIVEI